MTGAHEVMEQVPGILVRFGYHNQLLQIVLDVVIKKDTKDASSRIETSILSRVVLIEIYLALRKEEDEAITLALHVVYLWEDGFACFNSK